jgi:hypothetical protein
MTDQNRLVSLIGKPSDHADVKAWLKELRAPPVRLKKGDTSANVVLPKSGLELVFTDEAFFSRLSDDFLPEESWVLDGLLLSVTYDDDKTAVEQVSLEKPRTSSRT